VCNYCSTDRPPGFQSGTGLKAEAWSEFSVANSLRTIVSLSLLTVVLTLALKFFVAPRYGEDVGARFLERLNYIPSQRAILSKATLASWLADPANNYAIRGYVYPVLFPLDAVFLIGLGLLLGFASEALSSRLQFLLNIPTWIWWIFPMLYVASDLAEDSMIAGVFHSSIPLNEGSFRILRALTAIKLGTVTIAMGQVGFFGCAQGAPVVLSRAETNVTTCAGE
jgi:hypothetical protein